MAATFFLLLGLYLSVSPCFAIDSHASCFSKSKNVRPISSTHLYNKKKEKPLVIGHHGNPSKYQENTIDGFKSLKELKADGMEFDTFLTKDEQLVVIHYDNTETLTGKDHNIWDVTYNDLQQLDIKSTLRYGNKDYDFDKTRKIPLLSEVFDAVKDEELVMLLNLKPGYLRDRTESEKIGQTVAKLIAEKGLLDKVLLASFDPFKILAAKKENPSLTVGIFYKKGMWDQRDADDMKSEYGDLPGMRQCLESAPNGTEFMEFLFETGDLLRSTNSSFVVMDYNIYNNPKYSNNTFQTFKENYSPSLSFGAFIIDNLALTDEQRTKDDKILDMLIQNSASTLVTDNIPRLRKKLGRSSKGAPTGQPSTNKIALVLFGTVLFVCFINF
ncbi:uncharacterized protein [Porites lutea]|uniref:uncharacterized protein n=1 Tax=Porites lutea TaxID=51062 RepID=UPI003CC6997A